MFDVSHHQENGDQNNSCYGYLMSLTGS